MRLKPSTSPAIGGAQRGLSDALRHALSDLTDSVCPVRLQSDDDLRERRSSCSNSVTRRNREDELRPTTHGGAGPWLEDGGEGQNRTDDTAVFGRSRPCLRCPHTATCSAIISTVSHGHVGKIVGSDRVEAASRWQPQTVHGSDREPAGAFGGLSASSLVPPIVTFAQVERGPLG